VKLKTVLQLQVASAIVDEALRIARVENMMPLTVAVLDAGGRLVASKSEDGSGLLRHDVAFGKAWGALGMGVSSRRIRDLLANRHPFQATLGTASEGRFIPVPGGVLILDDEGLIIGAVGISGDTSEKDEYCAINAVHKAGHASEPAEVDPNWRG
jgi:uncharacterized protein GlcG (DUF336 family)